MMSAAETPFPSVIVAEVEVQSSQMDGDNNLDSNASTLKALQINTIIKCVYDFLGLVDLKNCRLVSQKWNFVAEPLLRKRSFISFCLNKGHLLFGSRCRTFEDFAQAFYLSTSSIPFEKFCLSGNNWRVSQLSEFFEKNKPFLKEVYLDNIILKDEKGTKLKLFDITPWVTGTSIRVLRLGDSEMDEEFNNTGFQVSLNKILNIKDLCLHGVAIDVSDMGSRHQPSNLTLKEVTFRKNGNLLPHYCVNEAFDFSKVEVDINLFVNSNLANDNNANITKMELDLKENFNVDELCLEGVKVLNWSASKSVVNKLSISGINISEKSGMTFKELRFDCDGGSIHFCMLPVTLEKLLIKNVGDSHAIVGHPLYVHVDLPNLKVVHLEAPTYLRSLEFMSECHNIVALEISRGSEPLRRPLALRLELLPKKLKKLKITGNERIIGKRKLETLILSCSLNDADKVLRQIKPETLILNWDQRFENNDSIIKFLKLRSGPTYAGPFDWDDPGIPELVFSSSDLANCVDQEAEYYFFENGKGKAIDEDEFFELSTVLRYF